MPRADDPRPATIDIDPPPRESRRSAAEPEPDDGWKSVRAAADRLAQQIAAGALGVGRRSVCEPRLEELVLTLRSVAQGGEAKARDDEGDAALDAHLLELLYREAVRDWASQAHAPASKALLSWLAAFEQVRETVAPRRDEPPALALNSTQGVELVVEFAHDLRSPLTSIIFLAETIRGGQAGPTNDLQRRQLGIIYSAALNLTSIASDVIEWARGGARLMERQPSPFSIAELLESTRDILQPIVEEKGLKMWTSGPEADQRLGHPVALSRVLLNLATNATKFTDAGSVEITARATQGVRVEFSVRDTGPGIDAETSGHLFEPLRRNPRNNRFGLSGSGLGLAICRRLVEAMGSELHYEAAEDRGTRFFFELDLPPAQLV